MADSPPACKSPLRFRAKVISNRPLSRFGYELVLERHGLPFQAGQLINVHGRSHLEDRSYTICSGERDPYLAILYRLIPHGVLTPYLAARQPGDDLEISGPYGEFTIRDARRPMVFFATGTGIAPCRSYRRSAAISWLMVVHGVRAAEDLFYREEFSGARYVPCLSGESHVAGTYHGRVTTLAPSLDFPEQAQFYLCGANEMIYEMRDMLEKRGVPRTDIFSEEYYYRFDDA